MFSLFKNMCVSTKCSGVVESCVCYLARAMNKFKTNYGDQGIHSVVLTGVSVQTKQTEHTERKPCCQCGKKIPRGTSVHHDCHQHTAAAPWLQKWTKTDISKCLLHVIYMSTHYTFSHRHLVISKSTVG